MDETSWWGGKANCRLQKDIISLKFNKQSNSVHYSGIHHTHVVEVYMQMVTTDLRTEDIREEQWKWQTLSQTHRYSLHYYLYLKCYGLWDVHLPCVMHTSCGQWTGAEQRLSHILSLVYDCGFLKNILIFLFLNRIRLGRTQILKGIAAKKHWVGGKRRAKET